MDLPYDFDCNSYKLLNNDLKNLNDNELIKHYLKHGINEGRIYKNNFNEIPNDFNVNIYKSLNNDLKNLTDNQLIEHYLKYGKNEGRIYKLLNNNLPEDFDIIFYRNYYNDLRDLSDNDLKFHYIQNGKNEGRIYNVDLIYNNDTLFNNMDDIELIYYINNNNNLSKIFNINFYNKINNKKLYFNKIKDIKSNFGIAISLYIDNNTPEERIIRSKKCINSVISNFYNNLIIILIDYEITNDYLTYLLNITKYSNNVLIFKNNKNEGIAKTKNICLKILEDYNIEYYCLLDDDVEIINNFENYIVNIFDKTNIPLIANSNLEYNYINNFTINGINFIKNKYFNNSDTHDYYGNILIINKQSLTKYGYFYIFNYGIGIEHIEITERYLKNTEFKGLSVNFNKYINNFEIINDKNTLFLHSKDVNLDEYNNNLNLFLSIHNKIDFVNFKFNKNDIIEIKNNVVSNSFYNNVKLNKYIFIKNKNLNNLVYNSDLIKSKINYIDFILWINLDKDIERKTYMYSILDDLNISNIRISGINGNEYMLNNNIKYNFQRKLNNGEIGCTFSHIKAINYCRKLDGKYFMICEDDIDLKNILIFNNNLEQIIKEAPDFDILLLYKTYFNQLNNTYEKWSDFYIENETMIEHIAGTVCYIITDNAIEKFCKNFTFINDNIIINDHHTKIDVADIFIYNNLNTYVYKYNFITTFENNSTIHLEQSSYQNMSHEYQKNILINYINDF